MQLSFAAAAGENPEDWKPAEPKFEFATRIYVELEAPRIAVGQADDFGERRIIPITGGHMEGPLLNGVVLNQGADWQIAKTDGTFSRIEARYVLKTNDGALIYIHTQGMKVTDPAIIALHKPVSPENYYFRQYLFFETSAPQYAWLNKTLAIGSIQSSFGKKMIVHDVYIIR